MKKYYRLPNGVTGRIFEWECLGSCKVKARGYMKFWTAMRQVRENQPWSPRQPKGIAGILHASVARAMGIPPQSLEFYTAVGSTLDRYHGIDGFFTFNGLTVTVDVTLNPNKVRAKARAVLSKEDMEGDCTGAADRIAQWYRIAKQCKWAGGVI